jgi:hypothetical protein
MCGSESMLWRVFFDRMSCCLLASTSDVCLLVTSFFLSSCTAFLSAVLISACFSFHLRLAFDGEQHSSGKMGFCFLSFFFSVFLLFFFLPGKGETAGR